ncbi:putative enoyl-CoA hydratase [Nymphon striatum]|nr:putative enoyl-CoA hydratase [Nymphon striatum]
MAYETITLDIDNHVALITLNRPDAMNALNDVLMGELAEGPKRVSGQRKGPLYRDHRFGKGICRMMKDKSFVDAFAGDLFTPETDQIMRVRKPIIAAFGQPEINLGVVAGIGGTQRLTRLVGKSKAMDMNLTGRFMDADEAERSGLVSRVVPVKKLMDEALGAAGKIAEKSMITVMVVKEAVNRAYEVPLREGLLFERRVFHSLRKEGMSAFLEKREAQFRDK